MEVDPPFLMWEEAEPLSPEQYRAMLEWLRDHPPKALPGTIQTEPSGKHWLEPQEARP